MTKLYRFGFGGFDEKPTPPFDSFHTDGRDYDFRHVQSMTKETDKVAKILIKPRPKHKMFQLITMIRDSPLSEGNKDSPEAGLDALMQVFCSYIMGSVWENELAVLVFELLEKLLINSTPNNF